MYLRNNKGFTLIELMITVSIIALLAAIAIPQYQNYILRSQMTRAYGEILSLRTAIEICQSDGQDDVCVSDQINSDMLLAAPTVSMSDPVSIAAEFGQSANTRLQGGTITLRRESSTGFWSCEMTVPGIPQDLRPRACQ